MKITDVKVWLVRGIKYNWTLLKIYTDEGYTGVGEATNWPGSPIVFEAAKHAGQRIIGLDPMKTDFIWTKLYRDLNWIGPYGASLCAISGIDMALLDLKAKVLGVPCYELLGGAYRKDILLYANYWFTGGGHNEADYAAQARRVMDAGFTGLKFDPFAHTNYFYGEDLASNLTLTAEQQDLAFNVSKAVREAVGPECDIMIETHAMLNYRVAVKMAERLAKLDITWYEEPAGPESSQTLRAMRERIPSDVAICVGERHYTRFGIRSLLESAVILFFLCLFLIKIFRYGLQHVTDSQTIHRRDRMGIANTQIVEFVDIRHILLEAVHLIDHQYHGLVGTAQHICNFGIRILQALSDIDNKHDHVCSCDRDLCLLSHL